MSRPIVVTVCMGSSSESWELYQPPLPWHSRAGWRSRPQHQKRSFRSPTSHGSDNKHNTRIAFSSAEEWTMRDWILVALLLAGAAIAVPMPAMAWDYPGHRIVGAIADLVLQTHYPATQKRVSDLLEIQLPNGLWQ